MSSEEYVYSEIFNSIQGEGQYTGVPTAWIRFFLCNLQCNGFGQDNPTDPSTYDLPFEKIDLTDITEVEQLPVFSKGCDSSYTWSKKFKHLMHTADANTIADRIVDVLRTDSNPDGLFLHPVSNQRSHLCFTGGEPLTPKSQRGIVGILHSLVKRGNAPTDITFETNGTKALTEDMVNMFRLREYNGNVFFSVSPKLWTVAGEPAKKAIKPDVVKEYYQLALRKNGGSGGQLKFVLGSAKEQWEEMEDVLSQFRAQGINWPVWIMPVGAREEEQLESAGDVAKMAFERGYNVSARVHTYLFGNAIGT